MSIRNIVIIILLLVSSYLIAQEEIRYGLKGGLNISTINSSVDNVTDFEPIKEFSFGAFMVYKMSQKFYLQPEILYTIKGATSEISIMGYDASGNQLGYVNLESELNLSYIQIPVIAKYKDYNQIGLYIGPALGILLTSGNNQKISSPDNNKYSVQTETLNKKDDTKSTEFSLILGGDFYWNHFIFDLRYDLGLTDIFKGDGQFKHRTYTFLLGYKF